jgi:hypothetical protein
MVQGAFTQGSKNPIFFLKRVDPKNPESFLGWGKFFNPCFHNKRRCVNRTFIMEAPSIQAGIF